MHRILVSEFGSRRSDTLSSDNIEGTACSVVTCSRSISSVRYSPSCCAPDSARIMQAPVCNAHQYSQTDRSKVAAVLTSTRSCAPSGN
ncbi:hypothetical protein B0E55_05463 [Rhodococcus sp. 66b]|nr:hypothetical protein B0E55_05463 [Rhodococcus sp. 66b]